MALDVTSLLVEAGPLVAGFAGIVVLIYALAVCVCGDKGNKNPVSDGKYKPNNESTEPDTDKKNTNSVAIDIDRSVTPLEDGHTQNDDLRISVTSQRSPGHSPHHANHRQLPAPPSSTGNGNLSTSIISRASTNKEEDDNDGEDDYDHLNDDRKPNNRLSNYDHVVLDADGKVQVKERKSVLETDYAEVNLSENIYTPVKDNGTSKVKDVVSSDRGQNHKNFNYSAGDPEDPYAIVNDDEKDVTTDSKNNEFYTEVKEDPYSRVKGDKEDPYAKVKGDKDDPYAKVKGDKDDPYSKVKGDKEDPYNKVKGDKDDPYSKVKGDKEDPYNKVKEPGEMTSSDDSDPYNKVKEEDPYNSVSEDEMDVDQGDDPYNKIKTDVNPYNKVRDDLVGARPKDPYSVVDPNRKRNSIKVTRNNGDSTTQEFLVEETMDEYAVVVKNRSETPTTVNSEAVHSPSVDSDQYQLPPEPPRNYRGEESTESGEVVSNSGQQIQGQGQVPQSSGNEANAAAVLPTTDLQGATVPSDIPPPQEGTGAVVTRKEPPYIKLTSRESMASINARRAQNTYETVVETENMYATVEGGSGDGIIHPSSTTVVKTSPPKNNRQSHPNDFYTEIGASGGSHPKVPAPPSLDSLHMMTKAHPDVRQGSRSSAEESDLRPLSDCISSPGAYSNHSENVSSARHSLDLHSFNGAVGGISEGPIKLDPNYQTVRDNINDIDLDCDIDPNYESVDEAKAKITKFEIKPENAALAKKRLHLYEEVKPASSSESTQARSRALRSHMYEDINEVQEQKKELNRKSQELEKKELNRKAQELDKKKSGKKK